MSESIVIGYGERTLAVEGLTFIIRPETYMDHARALDFVQRHKETLDDGVRDYVLVCWSVMQRITAWEGPVLPTGEPAPCDEMHKELLFGARPDLIRGLVEALMDREAEASKNSEPSQAG